MYVNGLELGYFYEIYFGNTTYLGWLWSGFPGHRSPFDYRTDYRFLVGSIFGILRTFPNRFPLGLGTLYVELFRNLCR